MKKLFLSLALCLIFSLFATSSYAAGDLIISTGSPNGTYKAFYDQIGKVCSQPGLVEKPSAGSRKNLEALLGNEANVGFVQEDALWAAKLIDNAPDIDTLKTLMVLYPEELHIIALRTSNINRFSDLGNKKVVTWGGSMVTTRILSSRTGVRFALFESKNEVDAMKFLNDGKVDAIIAVGGQPLPWIKLLPNKFKLVEFDRFDRVNDIYNKTNLNYTNLSNSGVPSIATNSMLVTIDYKTAGKVEDLSDLSNCILNNLDELKEGTGNHPKWRQVSAEAKAKWPMYNRFPAKGSASTKK